MPQGRRKTPFSGKAKKAQLQAKKEKKISSLHHEGDKSSSATTMKHKTDTTIVKGEVKPLSLGDQFFADTSKNSRKRYELRFFRETEAELRERKEAAQKTVIPVPETELEIAVEKFFPPEFDFPKRPPWNFDMNREQLEMREQKYFTEYVLSLEKVFGWKDMSYFELNLETWRQLWRVLEMSDIILIIVDIRFAALMFPPSLYQHVTEKLRKSMILILNKVDLAPAPLVVAWQHYFREKYPELHVLTFTSYPSYNLRGNQSNASGLQVRRRRGKMRMAAEGAQKLLEACKEIVGSDVDLSSWKAKISEEMEALYDDEDLEIEETIELKKVDTSYVEHVKYRGGTLTIGCVGQPNVGKSSLMNAVMGKKVVSVSRTPGHTKHFQTIYLTSNVRLCDCPGLVFPSRVPKYLQVLMGSFPIAQLREPYSSINYLAQRLDLPRLLKLIHPENDEEWSSIDICDGWALKRRFYTAHAARLDTYRAANNILRMALDGKICLCLTPPDFSMKKEYWSKHADVEEVRWIQAQSDVAGGETWTEELEEYSSEENESGNTASRESKESSSDSDEDLEPSTDDKSEDEEVPVGTKNKFAALLEDEYTCVLTNN